VVRRDAGNPNRAGRERCAGRAAGVHPSGGHLGLGAVLRAGHHDADRLVDGFIEVPQGVGFGFEPIAEVLDAVTTSAEWVGA